MADDGDEGEDRVPSRPMSAMGIEIEPDLEAPLLGTLQESSKPPSRVAPLLVLLGTYHHCRIFLGFFPNFRTPCHRVEGFWRRIMR